MPPKGYKAKKAAAQRARAGRAAKPTRAKAPSPSPGPPPNLTRQSSPFAENHEIASMSSPSASIFSAHLHDDMRGLFPAVESEEEEEEEENIECDWDGTVNFTPDTELVVEISDVDDDESDQGYESLSDIYEPILEAQKRVQAVQAANAFEKMLAPKGRAVWKKAEAKRALGYSGNAVRTKQRHSKEAHDGRAKRIAAKAS